MMVPCFELLNSNPGEVARPRRHHRAHVPRPLNAVQTKHFGGGCLDPRVEADDGGRQGGTRTSHVNVKEDRAILRML